jgi:hypothetical protein
MACISVGMSQNHDPVLNHTQVHDLPRICLQPPLRSLDISLLGSQLFLPKQMVV